MVVVSHFGKIKVGLVVHSGLGPARSFFFWPRQKNSQGRNERGGAQADGGDEASGDITVSAATYIRKLGVIVFRATSVLALEEVLYQWILSYRLIGSIGVCFFYFSSAESPNHSMP